MLFFTLPLILAVALLSHTPASAVQTVPYKMNFQGRLTDASGTPKPDGTYNIRFRIYNAASAVVWTEDRLVSASQGVTVTNGLFTVQLGSVTPLDPTLFNSATTNQGSMTLEVELPTPATATSSSPSWTEGAMTPRSPIATSAYAFNSDTIDGLDSTAFAAATGGSGYIQNQGASPQGASFNIQAPSASTTVGTIHGVSGQTADLLSLQNASSQPLSGFNAAGNLFFVNGSKVTLSASAQTGNFSLSIPTLTANDTVCLQSLANCASGGGGSLSTAYSTDPDGGDAIIALTTADGGILLRDAATPLATAFAVQNSTGTAAYFSASSSAVAMQDASGNSALLFDSTTSELHVYENVSSPSRYARVYFDTAANAAVFAASSGTTQIGAQGAGGDINLNLNGAANDKLNAAKTYAPTAAYSGTDFNFTRNLTGTSYALSGSVMKVEDNSSVTTGLSSPNVLYLNQSNTSATGNLILARTGGSTDKFKVDVAGNITAAGGVSVAAGQSYTGAGAVTVASASNTDLSLIAGGTGKVIVKPGSNSTSSFEVQDSSGAVLLAADSTNSRIKVGVSDANGTLLVLDDKTTSADPTGTPGAMYYNSSIGAFRCYEGAAWKNCVGDTYVYKTADQSSGTTAITDITDLSWSVQANKNYRYKCTIFFAAGATTNGWLVTATAPASPALFVGQTYGPISATTLGGSQWSANDGGTVTPTSGTTAAANGIKVEGILRNGANAGTVQMRWANELANTTHTIQQGSYCSYSVF